MTSFFQISVRTVIVFLLIQAGALAGQPLDHLRVEADQLRKVLLQNHCKPRLIDDVFSNEIFINVIAQLDPEKLYFTSADLQPIEGFRNRIDDEWKDGKDQFVATLTPVFVRSLKRAETMLDEAVRQKIDWEKSEEFDLDGPKAPANDHDLQQRWFSWIKYKILMQVKDHMDHDSLLQIHDVAWLSKHEGEEKTKIQNAERRVLRQLLSTPADSEHKTATAYLKAITASFDPHSVYLSPFEIENFMGALTSQEYSFGFELRELDNGDIAIERLVPGGPAWKSGQLHRNDVFVSMKPEDKPVVSLAGIGIEEFIRLIGFNNHLAMELTVQKSDGVKTSVLLRKEKAEDESSIVKGYILQGKNKVGYISLPGFYSDWGSEGGASCANDMAREILKMKKESIQGLILDIRSNGGGSVTEAIELAGIFIDEGPLALFRDQKGAITTLKDVNRGTIYDGPMVVLVDGRSASASELLAAALQDYHRAIIAGTSTFGKATGQRIFPLDPAVTSLHIDPARKPDAGYATVTIEKIYRVTGKSVQGSGVQPDIRLPDLFENLTEHESQLPNALVRDSVMARVPFKPRPTLPVAMLREKSLARIASNDWFKAILQTNKQIADDLKREHGSVNLDWNIFLNASSSVSRDQSVRHAQPYSAVLPTASAKTPSPNTGRFGDDVAWASRLMDDEHVGEAYWLLSDYLAINK